MEWTRMESYHFLTYWWCVSKLVLLKDTRAIGKTTHIDHYLMLLHTTDTSQKKPVINTLGH